MMNSPSPVRSARKRRRPAFSCTECRRRKVRCDRVMPCGQCKAHENASFCTYDERPRTLPVREASFNAGSAQQEETTQGDGPEEPHIPPPHASTPTTTSGRFQGIVSKTRVFGHGHWMAASSMVEDLSIFQPIGEYYYKVYKEANDDPTDEAAKAAANCKRLARDVKRQRPSRRRLPAGIHQSFPNRQVMDVLVGLYFKTFESCYRVLYLPSFMAEYESYIDNRETAESSFLLQLLLVMAAAGVLHYDAAIRKEIAAKALFWIHICQSWLSAPLEKDRLTLKGIQVQCLLLLCRQIYHVGPDLVWISVGSLLRMAMNMGLHQDPNNLGEMSQMSVQEKEVRRRLWYAILEMNVQTALDSGMSPMIRKEDYNTQPPSNVSDTELQNAVREEDISNKSTQVSLQSLLAKFLPLRLEIARVINSLQEGPSYDHILAIGNELTSACRNITVAVDQATSVGDVPSENQFAQSYCSHLVRRFALCLHFRYAIKAKRNPLYSYSQKVGHEAALDLVALLDDDLYSRLLVAGGGMFRDIITRGALLIFLELSPDPEAETSSSAKKRNRSRQSFLLQEARRIVQYTEDRIRHGETDVKTYGFLRMMLAQAEGRFNGSLTDEDLTNALHDGLNICHQILEGMVADSAISNNTDVMSPGHFLESWTPSRMNGSPSVDLEADPFDFMDNVNVDFDFLNPQFSPEWLS